MAVPFYRPGSGDVQPDLRETTMPDGHPAPTGYFPDRSNPHQGYADFSPVYDELYGPAREEVLDAAEKRDQHPWLQVSGTWTPSPAGPRKPGRNDPLEDGPAQPTPRRLHLFYQRAQGTSVTHFYDAPGLRYPPNGSQDGATWVYFQDPVRGLADFAPGPDSPDGQMPDTLRALPPSPPHGWSEQPVMNAKEAENAKFQQMGQQRAPHRERLANSTYAGQSYSARTVHVGASGTGASGTTPSWRSRG